MSGNHSTIRTVAYYRKSDDDDGASVEQQQQGAHTAAPQQRIEIVREFIDQAKAGWQTAARSDFHEMLAFCQKQAKAGTPIDAVLCWKPNRFSRADSQETSWFIWEFRKAGIGRMFTAARDGSTSAAWKTGSSSASSRMPAAIATSWTWRKTARAAS